MLYLRRIVGHSMEPRLKSGRIILVSRSNKFRKGDVVVAKPGDKEIIKMVQNIKGTKYFLAGNGPKHDEGWVEEQFIRGRMIWPRR